MFIAGGSPEKLETPVETTSSERRGPSSACSACLSKASAMGLRQVLAVQTKVMRFRSTGIFAKTSSIKVAEIDVKKAL